MIRFSVAGVPRTKGSMRPFTTAGRAHVREQMGDLLQTWREQLSAALAPIGAQLDGPMAEPVAVFVTFRLPAPKRQRWAWPIAKGRNDLDKLCRTLLDHLSGVIIEDDAQVAVLAAAKTYGTPGADVVLVPMSGLADGGHWLDARIDLEHAMHDLLDALGAPELVRA